MDDQWNENIFQDFILLRDALRVAKREKNYQRIISLGLDILELNKTAAFLKIATPVFLKDMSEAYIKLGDVTSAIKYLIEAKTGFQNLEVSSADWKKDIEMIDKKIEKLTALRV
jgi:hypothetical protein